MKKLILISIFLVTIFIYIKYISKPTSCQYALSGNLSELKKLSRKELLKTDRKNNSALMYSILFHKNDVTEFLLNAGFNPDIRNEMGATPLMLASSLGKKDTIQILLAHSANLNAQDKNGVTPLMSAAYEGQSETIALLLNSKAAPCIVDKFGNQAINYAIDRGENGSLKVIQNFKTENHIFCPGDNHGR